MNAVHIFIAGITGVFLGMAAVYAVIVINARISAKLEKKGEKPS